jgi:hypothetical protein
MGLDMYLEKETYVKNWDFMKPEELYEITIKRGDKIVKHIKPERISKIVEEVGYWRKANSIHKWFVNNTQDGIDNCQRSYVSREDLQRLLETVNQVLQNHSLAKDLLPPESGFFFGSIEVDDYYFQDLEMTKIILDTVLTESIESDFYYHASW